MNKLTKLNVADPDHGAAISWLNNRQREFGHARRAGEQVGPFLNNYRNSHVKEAILSETYKKCAYCEAKYKAVTWGDVEHILPKDRDPERLLDYDNLTLACNQCNGWKSNKEYYDGAGLLNPYIDDPQPFMYAAGSMLVPVVAQHQNIRATRTIDDLHLNRESLMESRRDVILNKCHVLLREYVYSADIVFKNFVLGQIEKLKAPDAEFSFVVRAFFAFHQL